MSHLALLTFDPGIDSDVSISYFEGSFQMNGKILHACSLKYKILDRIMTKIIMLHSRIDNTHRYSLHSMNRNMTLVGLLI